MLLALALVGCKAVDPAPADLDGLLRWFWQGYEEADDETLHQGVVNAFDLVDLQALAEDVQDGSLSALSDEDIALVGITDRTAADAAGMYLLSVFQCDLQTLQPLLYALDQDALYPGTYEAYERTYTSSIEDYASGAASSVDWQVAYTGKYLGSSYDTVTMGGLRRLPDLGEEASPHGEVVLQRTYMPEPAQWESGDKVFDQDYQLEVYVETGAGTLLHLYGMWRHAEYGAGLSTDDEGVQRLILNALADWDEQTEAHCLAGGI